MSNDLTWAPPSYFQPSNSDPSWIRSIDLKKYPRLYTKKDEASTYELAQINFKALGEFWINRSSITQYVAPIAAVTGLVVSAFLLSIPGIILSLSVIGACIIAWDVANDIRIMTFKKYCLEVEEMFSTIETETISFKGELEKLKDITEDNERFSRFKDIIQEYNKKVFSGDEIDDKIKELCRLSNQFRRSIQYKDLAVLTRFLLLVTQYYNCLGCIDTIFKHQEIDSSVRHEEIEKKIPECVEDIIIWSKRMRENIEVVRLSTNIRSQRDKNNQIKA